MKTFLTKIILALAIITIWGTTLIIAPLTLNPSITQGDSFSIMIGVMVAISIIAFLLIYTAIVEFRKLNIYKQAKEDKASLQTLFKLNGDYNKFRYKTAPLITCAPLPYILLAGFCYGLVDKIKGGIENLPIIIILSICVLFLLFICVAMIVAPISYYKQNKQKVRTKLQGTLKKVVASTNMTHSKGEVEFKQYHLVISYQLDGHDYEFRSSESYSETQLQFIKALAYIPLEIVGEHINIDNQEILTTQEFALNNVDVEVESGVASFGSNEVKQVDSSASVRKIIESEASVERRNKEYNQINIAFMIIASIFFTIWTGVAIFAAIYEKSPILIAFAIICISFAIFMLTMIIIKPIIKNKLRKKIIALGRNSVATSYKICFSHTKSSNILYNGHYSITFHFLDDYGKERISAEPIAVSRYFFTAYSVEKLPIKIWKKHATIDYKTLLTYQNKD